MCSLEAAEILVIKEKVARLRKKEEEALQALRWALNYVESGRMAWHFEDVMGWNCCGKFTDDYKVPKHARDCPYTKAKEILHAPL